MNDRFGTCMHFTFIVRAIECGDGVMELRSKVEGALAFSSPFFFFFFFFFQLPLREKNCFRQFVALILHYYYYYSCSK